MTDPLRTDRPRRTADSPERDRDARVEASPPLRARPLLHRPTTSARSASGRASSSSITATRARAPTWSAPAARSPSGIARAKSCSTPASKRSAAATLPRHARPADVGGRTRRSDGRGAGAARTAASVSSRRPGAKRGRRGATFRLARKPTSSRASQSRRASRWRWVCAGVAAGVLAAAAGGWVYCRGADLWLLAGDDRARRGQPPERAAAGAGGVRGRARAGPVAARQGAAARRAQRARGRAARRSAWAEAQALRATMQRQLLAGVGAPLDRTSHAGPGARPMRCPKCRYIGFDEQDRCRNCGYDFSLSQPASRSTCRSAPASTPTPMADLRLSVQRRRSAAAALTPPGADSRLRGPGARGDRAPRRSDAGPFRSPALQRSPRRHPAGQRQHAAAARRSACAARRSRRGRASSSRAARHRRSSFRRTGSSSRARR